MPLQSALFATWALGFPRDRANSISVLVPLASGRSRIRRRYARSKMLHALGNGRIARLSVFRLRSLQGVSSARSGRLDTAAGAGADEVVEKGVLATVLTSAPRSAFAGWRLVRQANTASHTRRMAIPSQVKDFHAGCIGVFEIEQIAADWLLFRSVAFCSAQPGESMSRRVPASGEQRSTRSNSVARGGRCIAVLRRRSRCCHQPGRPRPNGSARRGGRARRLPVRRRRWPSARLCVAAGPGPTFRRRVQAQPLPSSPPSSPSRNGRS